MNDKTKNSKKVMVIGLDGVSCSLLSDYMAKGYLPECEQIIKKHFKLHQMQASIPDVSSTSWTSFVTGVNPGEHGIYGFMDLQPHSYKMFFPNSRDVRAPSLWDILGQKTNGKNSTLLEKYHYKIESPLRSIVLNIPQTYPALEINGILTAGFVCPDFQKGTYPPSAYEYLNSIGYLADINVRNALNSPADFFKEASLALEKRSEAYAHFLNSEPWDLFIGVITETDRINHFFFNAASREDHPYHEIFVDFYRQMDKLIGRLFKRFMEITDGEGLFMTLSDHGFVEIQQEVNINVWLKEIGFLKKDDRLEYFEQIDYGTRALAMDPARIYVNTEHKYPRGEVKAADRKSVAAELKNRLTELVDGQGRLVMKHVYENEELYSGPDAALGPDLVCIAHDGFDLKSSMEKENVFEKSRFTGMHTQHDAHCILPHTIEIDRQLHIEHLSDIILKHFTGQPGDQ